MSCHGSRNHRVADPQTERIDRRTAPVARAAAAVPVATADPDLRAGDRDRDQTTAVLSEAYAQGYLDLVEFEQRSEQVLRAHTMGQLSPLVADLPMRPSEAGSARASQPIDRQRAARQGLKAHALSYAAGMAIMVGIWLVTAVLFGVGYFWPIWPALGWGIGVPSHALPVLRGTNGAAVTAGAHPGPAQLPR